MNPLEELAHLTVQAGRDDLAALARIRDFLDEHPEIWAQYGDVARQVQLALADHISHGNVTLKESLLRKAEAQAQELAPGDSPPLIRLLAGNVSACALGVAQAELAALDGSRVGLTLLDYLEKRRDRAQKRFLQAAKTLATVQKLLDPPTKEYAVTIDARGPEKPKPRNTKTVNRLAKSLT